MASWVATPCWKRLNIRLLTVLLPAMNAPSAPIVGANNGQMLPTCSATHVAMAMGIDGNGSPPAKRKWFVPELMYTRTMGTVNNNTNPAPSRIRLASLMAPVICRRFM